ncbi:hypothetical protein KIM322_10630 [Lactobacillus xylocopicola]|uniref:Uncharacterized protein n=1 Tax=Lactobacillus xylocopicola TaxID=2976676 RepID=A0ABN6SKC1_9LACO|nr:hypothetical protein KIM322_10630 [Lactobacillus xylocopicola]
MECLSLLGVLVIVVGFALGLDTVAVVVIAALVTALVSGIDFVSFLRNLGKGFVDNRMVSLFFLTLPTIGILERHGLKQASVNLIKKLKNLTPGRISISIRQFVNWRAFLVFHFRGMFSLLLP